MGKKRIAIIGDISAEEQAKKKKEIKREQKALREGQVTEKMKKKVSQEKKKAAKAPGLKGGERVVDTAGKAMEEAEVQRQREEEIKKLKAEAAVEEGKAEEKPKPKRERSNRYKKMKGKMNAGESYSPSEAVKLLREVNMAKFDATVEMHVNLVKEGLKFQVELPYSTGKAKRVAVADAKTIKKIEAGEIDFDVLLATPEQMAKLIPLAKVLGPKGLMPNPKDGTVVKEPEKAAKEFGKANKLEVKAEKKAPLAHLVIGKMAMKDEELVGNIEAVLKAVEARNLKKVVVKSSMSPAVRVKVE